MAHAGVVRGREGVAKNQGAGLSLKKAAVNKSGEKTNCRLKSALHIDC
jgi:hypothetical protein